MRKWLAKMLLGKDYNVVEVNVAPRKIVKPVHIMIDEILQEFDFAKVHYVMQELNWTWVKHPANGFKSFDDIEHAEVAVPSIDTLKLGAVHRIWAAIEEAQRPENAENSEHCPYIVSSGGFKATVYKDKEGLISWIDLEFVLTEWDSIYDEID
jgi:hypothetical protein